jgi:hypothetical protein
MTAAMCRLRSAQGLRLCQQQCMCCSTNAPDRFLDTTGIEIHCNHLQTGSWSACSIGKHEKQVARLCTPPSPSPCTPSCACARRRNDLSAPSPMPGRALYILHPCTLAPPPSAARAVPFCAAWRCATTLRVADAYTSGAVHAMQNSPQASRSPCKLEACAATPCSGGPHCALARLRLALFRQQVHAEQHGRIKACRKARVEVRAAVAPAVDDNHVLALGVGSQAVVAQLDELLGALLREQLRTQKLVG